jgi:hypothetical protein
MIACNLSWRRGSGHARFCPWLILLDLGNQGPLCFATRRPLLTHAARRESPLRRRSLQKFYDKLGHCLSVDLMSGGWILIVQATIKKVTLASELGCRGSGDERVGPFGTRMLDGPYIRPDPRIGNYRGFRRKVLSSPTLRSADFLLAALILVWYYLSRVGDHRRSSKFSE